MDQMAARYDTMLWLLLPRHTSHATKVQSVLFADISDWNLMEILRNIETYVNFLFFPSPLIFINFRNAISDPELISAYD